VTKLTTIIWKICFWCKTTKSEKWKNLLQSHVSIETKHIGFGSQVAEYLFIFSTSFMCHNNFR